MSDLSAYMWLGQDDDLDWQARALCAQTDPEEFFPENGQNVTAAKRTCLSCEVRDECLTYALDNDERFGVWGGLTERERRALKRKRKAAAAGGTETAA